MVGTQLSLTAAAFAFDGTDLSSTVTWSNQSGTALGTGPSLTTTLDEAGSVLIVAEATDADNRLGRAQLALDVLDPTVELTRPNDDVTAVSGESLAVEWTWNGSSDSTATLALAPLTDVDQEVSNGTISDHSTTIVPIDIDDDTTVDNLTVSLRADHTYLGDLTVRLISPSGTEVVLVERRGVTATISALATTTAPARQPSSPIPPNAWSPTGSPRSPDRGALKKPLCIRRRVSAGNVGTPRSRPRLR